MLYYQLKFNEFPDVTFAHVFSKINYCAEFAGGNDSIEIVYIEKGEAEVYTEAATVTIPETTIPETTIPGITIPEITIPEITIPEITIPEITIPENSIYLAFKKQRLKFQSKKDTVHTHYTVNLKFQYDIDICDGKNSLDNKSRSLLLPMYLKLDDTTSYLKERLKEILTEYNSHNTAYICKCSAMAMELLCDISRQSIAQMNAINEDYTPSQYYTCSQIKTYIANNLNKKITLAEIAVKVGKSPNYINWIFKKVTHDSIKQYINKEKINKVMQLMLNYGITLKEAGENVGIYDESYVSRLFKKTSSMSAKKFISSSYKKETNNF